MRYGEVGVGQGGVGRGKVRCGEVRFGIHIKEKIFFKNFNFYI